MSKPLRHLAFESDVEQRQMLQETVHTLCGLEIDARLAIRDFPSCERCAKLWPFLLSALQQSWSEGWIASDDWNYERYSLGVQRQMPDNPYRNES